MIRLIRQAAARRRNRRQIRAQIQWGIEYIRHTYGPSA